MSSGSNIEKENIPLEFSTTKDCASLFEDQDRKEKSPKELKKRNKFKKWTNLFSYCWLSGNSQYQCLRSSTLHPILQAKSCCKEIPQTFLH
jgi:hypothetical protein